ncbi:hypothetical protein Tco_1109087 [Tanacetum coccineum]
MFITKPTHSWCSHKIKHTLWWADIKPHAPLGCYLIPKAPYVHLSGGGGVAVAATAAMVVLGGDAARWRSRWWWWLLRRDDKDGGGAAAGGMAGGEMAGDGVTGWRSGGDRFKYEKGFSLSTHFVPIPNSQKLSHMQGKRDPTVRRLESGQYGISIDLDTAYRGFLDSFGYGVLDLVPSWSSVKCRHRYSISSLMDTAYWLVAFEWRGDVGGEAVGRCVVAAVKMAVEARGIVDRLDPVKRNIFEVGRRTRRKIIPAVGDGGRTWEGRERGEVCV